jgi:large subunit ribosomal protein L30
MVDVNKLKITLIKSLSARLPRHIATIESLGLSRLHQSIVVKDIPSVRGMINKVAYLLKVEEVK